MGIQINECVCVWIDEMTYRSINGCVWMDEWSYRPMNGCV